MTNYKFISNMLIFSVISQLGLSCSPTKFSNNSNSLCDAANSSENCIVSNGVTTVSQEFEVGSGKVDILFVNDNSASNSVPKAVTPDWEMDLNIDLNKKTIMVPVYSTSEPDKKGWITAEVKKYATVAILNRDLKVGDSISESMIEFDMRYISPGSDPVLTRAAMLGMQTTKFISAGQVISFRDLKRETILKKGQIVKAVFGKDDFEVSISALAEESGSLGDVLKFKNIDSQKMFSAKVEDKGLVRIE